MNLRIACDDVAVAAMAGSWLRALGSVRVDAPEPVTREVVSALRTAGMDGAGREVSMALGTVTVHVGAAGPDERACPVGSPNTTRAGIHSACQRVGKWASELLTEVGLRRAYGDAVRPAFLLEPDMVFLNHGSYGATPRSVIEAQQAHIRRLESQPVAFMQGAPRELRQVMGRVAPRLGAEVDDIVFVDNATSGIMAVLRSLGLGPGDALLTTSHAYPAIAKALDYTAERSGCGLRVAEVPFPLSSPDEVIHAVMSAVRPDVRVAVLDHIASVSGVVFPLETLIGMLQDKGIWVLIDGAHAPGHLCVDLPFLGADWYVGNLHKWLFTPKGCGVLWAKPEVQPGLAPLVISLGYGQGFADAFEYQGTRDPSGWLATGAALDFVDSCGGLDAIRAHNRLLAHQGAQRVADRLGLEWGAPPQMCGALVSLPLPGVEGEGMARGLALELWQSHRVQSFVGVLGDTVSVRIGAQIYNTLDDFDRLAEGLAACL